MFYIAPCMYYLSTVHSIFVKEIPINDTLFIVLLFYCLVDFCHNIQIGKVHLAADVNSWDPENQSSSC